MALEETLRGLSADTSVHGILLLRPLPPVLDEARILRAIAPEKDVDGATEGSLAAVYAGTDGGFPPCTAQAVTELLEFYQIPVEGKHAVVLGRSLVVGRPAAMLLLGESATVTICHSKTSNLKEHTLNADILVAAVGVPGLVTGDMIKPGAIVIDAGINRVEGKTVGDVDFASAEPVAGYISPVPGGVGPVTRTILVANTLTAAEKLNGLD